MNTENITKSIVIHYEGFELSHWSTSNVKYLPLNEKLLGDDLFRVLFNNSELKSEQ